MFEFFNYQPFLDGFLLGVSLIAAIGAQNLFVLRQGISGQHVFTTAFVSSISDFALICIGTMGAGSLVSSVPGLRLAAVICGIIFLLYYGVKSALNLIQGKSLELVMATENRVNVPRKTVILSALGFSLLNPHALLDALVLIGGISAQYEALEDRGMFGIGAGISSIIWFFCLAYGAKFLGPVFRTPTFAKVLDVLVCGIMFGIAWSLARAELLAN